MHFYKNNSKTISNHDYLTSKLIQDSVDKHMEQWGNLAVESTLIAEGKIPTNPPTNIAKYMYCKFLIYLKTKAVRREIAENIYSRFNKALTQEEARVLKVNQR